MRAVARLLIAAGSDVGDIRLDGNIRRVLQTFTCWHFGVGQGCLVGAGLSIVKL